jgi:hypothetical protein
MRQTRKRIIDRGNLERVLNKQEATRHLVHSAIRLFGRSED